MEDDFQKIMHATVKNDSVTPVMVVFRVPEDAGGCNESTSG
jgi:hypothetical protein